jgi:hypothetical protein
MTLAATISPDRWCPTVGRYKLKPVSFAATLCRRSGSMCSQMLGTVMNAVTEPKEAAGCGNNAQVVGERDCV